MTSTLHASSLICVDHQYECWQTGNPNLRDLLLRLEKGKENTKKRDHPGKSHTFWKHAILSNYQKMRSASKNAVSKIQNENEKMLAIRGDFTVATAQVLGVVLLGEWEKVQEKEDRSE